MPADLHPSEPSYEELSARLKEAQRRILELERMLMRQMAQPRNGSAKREVEQGQPLLDLVEGHTPTAPEGEEADDMGTAFIRKKERRGRAACLDGMAFGSEGSVAAGRRVFWTMNREEWAGNRAIRRPSGHDPPGYAAKRRVFHDLSAVV